MGARTLGNGHPTLLDVLEPGMRVLDVGCGPGALSGEMARRVAPGWVVAMDVNPQMIRAAEAAWPPDLMPNLVFYAGDVRTSRWDAEFDLANAARTLQWLPDAHVAVARMTGAVRPGGLVALLDHDHTRARWHDEPEAWRRFYSAFLDWRAAAGLDNATARRLPALARAAGLVDLQIVPRITTVRSGDADFFRVAGHWRLMIDSRGRQIIAAGHLREAERRAALDAYTEWMMHRHAAHTIYETCVVARRPEALHHGARRGGPRGRARWTR
jgi:ubiquinone/menaquinone biosynthesis C-methylase UbiE